MNKAHEIQKEKKAKEDTEKKIKQLKKEADDKI